MEEISVVRTTQGILITIKAEFAVQIEVSNEQAMELQTQLSRAFGFYVAEPENRLAK